MKKTLTIRFITSLIVFSVPFVASATSPLSLYKNLIVGAVNDYFVPMLIAVAFITFLWGVYKYFIIPDGEREEGRQFIMYGIIGLVVIFSVWGLVNIVKDTIILDGGNSKALVPPKL